MKKDLAGKSVCHDGMISHSVQEESSGKRYRHYSRRRLLIFLISLISLPVLMIVAVSLGPVRISFTELFRIFTGQGGESVSASIIFQSRLPQVLTAVLAGAGLSTIGAAMQSVLRNPLSSPFTLGISSAAAFGAACVVIFGGGKISALDNIISGIGLPYGSITLGAFVSSLLATGLILLLSGRKHVRTETVILTGVALSSFYAAGIMLLQYFAEEQQLAAMIYWTFGDTARGSWAILGILALLVIVSGIWFCSQSWNYNALALGEETARGLGISVRRVRGMTMLVCSLVTAVLVSTLGVIGFVGLVVPHLCRLFVGSDNRYVLPLSFFAGAGFLLVSDTFARMVLAPRLMPVSILTALIGAPFFLLMLLRRNANSC